MDTPYKEARRRYNKEENLEKIEYHMQTFLGNACIIQLEESGRIAIKTHNNATVVIHPDTFGEMCAWFLGIEESRETLSNIW